jgi:hypothetical protein
LIRSAIRFVNDSTGPLLHLAPLSAHALGFDLAAGIIYMRRGPTPAARASRVSHALGFDSISDPLRQ